MSSSGSFSGLQAAIIEPHQLPAEIWLAAAADPIAPMEPTAHVSHQSRVNGLIHRMLVEKESFWTTVYPGAMMRDIQREDLRFIVHAGLEHTRGSYRLLVEHFNMPTEDYKRMLGFLRQHDCHLPFQRFRLNSARRPLAV